MKSQDHARQKADVAKKAGPLGELISRGRAFAGQIPPPPVVSTPTKRRRQSAKNDLEAPVLHDCLKWLHDRGIFAYRQNTGTIRVNGRPISFGFPGAADITGILPDGRRLEVECKSLAGKQTEKQKRFQAKIEASNGVYILARNVQDLERQWSVLC